MIDGLDEKDNQIVNLLRENGRLTYSDIGDKVGLSRVAVKNRVKSLEEKKIISGYKAIVNPAILPSSFPFMIYVVTKPDKYDSVCEKLKNEPMLSHVFQMNGNNLLIVIGVAKSNEAKSNLAWKLRNMHEEIENITTKDIWEVSKGVILPE